MLQVAGLAETHRSFVNTWECDENDHLNVQFYLRRFDEAARFHAAGVGGSLDAPLPKVRHVRFHSELRAAGITRTLSGFVADGRFAGHVVHLLEDIENGVLAATAIDAPGPGAPPPGPSATPEAGIARALPRGVSAEPAVPMAPAAVLGAGGLLSFRAIAAPASCDARGEMLEQHYVSCFTDAAPHVWNHAGIGLDWLRRRNFGRVAVEMKITHHSPARLGEGLVVHSLPSLPGGKTIRLRHEVTRPADDAPIVTAEIVAVVLDLATRRTVDLPPGLAGQDR